jgi:hypothetical protein
MIMAGPVSSASPDGPGWFVYIFFGVVACIIVWTLVQDWKRTKEIRRYAEKKGLTYMGASLLISFPLSETSVSWASSFKNAVAGDRAGKTLLFFDCTLGSGKGRRTQTVVAVRGSEDCFGPVRFGPFLKMEKVGEWTLIYRSKERLPLEEIDALLSNR